MRVFASALIASFVLAPVPARADERPSRHVAYGDLDLARPGDVTRFKSRVENAVIAVCGPKIAGDRVGAARVDSCRAETRAAVAPRVWAAIERKDARLASLEIEAAR